MSKAEAVSGPLAGMTLISFESRLSSTVMDGINRLGGTTIAAPSLQEIPFESGPELSALRRELLGGNIAVMIFMTGIGVKMIYERMKEDGEADAFVAALNKTTVIARGPKPLRVLHELGVASVMKVPEPNTWEQILEAIDLGGPEGGIRDKVVAVQEYGMRNEKFLQGLLTRGARVLPVPVYRWAMPDDRGPLESAVRKVSREEVDGLVFTSAVQVRHVIQIARELGLEDVFRRALHRVLVISIGPTCSEMLRHYRLPVDLEPSRPKLGPLFKDLAERFRVLLEEKRQALSFVYQPRQITEEDKDRRLDSAFLKACRHEATPYTPVWLMRQAGRYMKEYRRVRERVSFLELCRSRELIAEVTITACEKIQADAAIIFSDILLIVQPFGMGLEYTAGDGPVITSRIRNIEDVRRMPEFEPAEELPYVYEGLKLTRACLNPLTPLIGFSAAPFTLASYMLEGGGSRVFRTTKEFMYREKEAWHCLMEKITEALIKHLVAQVEAGADALQIFDSWIGCLAPADYEEYVLPHSRRLIAGVSGRVPVIHFGTGTGPFLKRFSEAGGDVVGVDFHMHLGEAWDLIGRHRSVQGNLDPVILFAPVEEMKRRARLVLQEAGNSPGHIFNLGHGVLPGTPVEHVIELIQEIKTYSAELRKGNS